MTNTLKQCIGCGAWRPMRVLVDEQVCEECFYMKRLPPARAVWRTWCGSLLRIAADYIDPKHDESGWYTPAYNSQREHIEAE